MWIRFKENILIDVSKFDSIIIDGKHDPRGNAMGWKIIGVKSNGYNFTIGTYEAKQDALSDLSTIELKLQTLKGV